MRAKQIAVRAALVCGAAGIACALWSAADDTAASAADPTAIPLPGAVEVTGGLADTADRTVEQLPHRAAKLAKDAGRKPKAVEHVRETVEQPLSTVEDALQPVRNAAPAEVPKLPDTPTGPALAVVPAPAAPEAVPAVVLLSDPAPSTVTIDPTQAVFTAPAAAFALLCNDQVDEATPPRPGHAATPSGAPCVPDDRDTTGLAAVKPPTKTGGDQLAATTPSGPATPALLLLGELLPRSDLPTGRTTHPEPGPA